MRPIWLLCEWAEGGQVCRLGGWLESDAMQFMTGFGTGYSGGGGKE